MEVYASLPYTIPPPPKQDPRQCDCTTVPRYATLVGKPIIYCRNGVWHHVALFPPQADPGKTLEQTYYDRAIKAGEFCNYLNEKK